MQKNEWQMQQEALVSEIEEAMAVAIAAVRPVCQVVAWQAWADAHIAMWPDGRPHCNEIAVAKEVAGKCWASCPAASFAAWAVAHRLEAKVVGACAVHHLNREALWCAREAAARAAAAQHPTG